MAAASSFSLLPVQSGLANQHICSTCRFSCSSMAYCCSRTSVCYPKPPALLFGVQFLPCRLLQVVVGYSLRWRILQTDFFFSVDKHRLAIGLLYPSCFLYPVTPELRIAQLIYYNLRQDFIFFRSCVSTSNIGRLLKRLAGGS